ncbi:MAG: glycine cleavage T C-terminal barrel domain-containing protein, partial [Acidobacteriota bacterium]
DLIVYRLSDDAFMLVVNAATVESDYEWIHSHISEPVSVHNISSETAKVDIQGPGAPAIVQSLLDQTIEKMKYYRFIKNVYMGRTVLISRTGYTGEVGFEVYSDPETIDLFWNACLAEGAVAAGLGARNTLRLEIGLPLHGHELGPKRNASDSGMDRFISKKKRFVGSASIREGAAGRQRLVGLKLDGKQAAREGNRILSENDTVIGEVTSGSFAPSLGYAVALGYVENAFTRIGTKVHIKGLRVLSGRIQETPFYKKGTARESMSEFL